MMRTIRLISLGLAAVCITAQAQSLSPEERRAVAKNMGATEQQVRELESRCARGNQYDCQLLQAYKSKTFEQLLEEDRRRAELACARGDTQVCENLYCRPDPSNLQCLEKMRRASGANWYEDSGRLLNSDGRTIVSITCKVQLPPNAPHQSFRASIFCAGRDSDCSHNQVEQTPGQKFEGISRQVFATLRLAAEDACQTAVARYRRNFP